MKQQNNKVIQQKFVKNKTNAHELTDRERER